MMTGSILVTGGAGYIGSHAVRALVDAGHRVVVVDNLSRGHRAAVHGAAEFLQMDLRDSERLTNILRERPVDRVIHFAALAYVGESVADPLAYYDNNVSGSLSLLTAMRRANVRRIVFSSTCATYGGAVVCPIAESAEQRPVNPYGRSKLFVEQILRDEAAADPTFSFVALRYFNVAGCAADGSLGEDHRPETHAIPLLLLTALGRRKAFSVFGDDYPTPDGTCIRDYVHVEDLVQAHLSALPLTETPGGSFFNVGLGRGYSVLEAIESVKRVTGRSFDVERHPRRLGDPAELWASGEKISRELNWSPRFRSLDDIVQTAWQWFEANPEGYDVTAPVVD